MTKKISIHAFPFLLGCVVRNKTVLSTFHYLLLLLCQHD
nr:MAG TPA: hypothetical protein [Caudoviricetes sp.]